LYDQGGTLKTRRPHLKNERNGGGSDSRSHFRRWMNVTWNEPCLGDGHVSPRRDFRVRRRNTEQLRPFFWIRQPLMSYSRCFRNARGILRVAVAPPPNIFAFRVDSSDVRLTLVSQLTARSFYYVCCNHRTFVVTTGDYDVGNKRAFRALLLVALLFPFVSSFNRDL